MYEVQLDCGHGKYLTRKKQIGDIVHCECCPTSFGGWRSITEIRDSNDRNIDRQATRDSGLVGGGNETQGDSREAVYHS